MCTVCGCGTEQVEGAALSHSHDHGHAHSHGSHHHDSHSHGAHSHEHNHEAHSHEHVDHAHGNHIHQPTEQQTPSVVHHHYHNQGDVHLHIHYGSAAPQKNHSQHSHSQNAEHEHGQHSHDHHTHSSHDHGSHAEHSHHHEHTHSESEHTPEIKNETLHYGVGEASTHVPGLSQQRIIEIEQDILGKNNHIADHNRSHFNADELTVLNLVSSPGSGKTTLLTETIKLMQKDHHIAVIEGDQQTANDAERIRATGVKAIQVNTGKGCHLDASMVDKAYHQLQMEKGSILFIENVGNLVCPADFDLGEQSKVAILSVTEGEDKPLKYPNMFAAASLMIINKTDLLPYVNFDVAQCIENARRVNPEIKVICLSATTSEGMQRWIDWILGDNQVCA